MILPKASIKVIKYYLLFNCLVIFIHLSLVSIFSFFHFLLDHEIGIIEDWLIHNTWIILVLDKAIALSIIIFFRQFQFDLKSRFKEIRKEKFNIRFLGFAVFLLISIFALIDQFGGGVNKNNIKDSVLLMSFLSSASFYFIDFLYLFLFKIELEKKGIKRVILLGIILFVMHKVCEEVILPDARVFQVIYIIHFVTLFIFYLKRQFYSILGYCFLVISSMSAFFGIDLVWDSAYSLYTYKETIPILGIVGVWCIGLKYLFYNFKKESKEQS